VDLSLVPVEIEGLTPEEILICETQGRMALQVAPEDVDEVMISTQFRQVEAAVIGEITADDKEIFAYQGETVAVIPNEPSEAVLQELRKGK
jgi:phosphoribosylformylglycinamidine synthase